MSFVACDQPTEVLKPREEALDLPSPAVPSKPPTISIGWPVLRSYSVRSTAQPRLCRDPFAGSATNTRSFSGVVSQNIFVTCHGR